MFGRLLNVLCSFKHYQNFPSTLASKIRFRSSFLFFIFIWIHFFSIIQKDRKFSNKTVIQNGRITFHSNFLFTLPIQLNICSCNHFVKSVQIRSFFWSVCFCIQTEYREIRTRKNSVFGHFQAVYVFFCFIYKVKCGLQKNQGCLRYFVLLDQHRVCNLSWPTIKWCDVSYIQFFSCC